MGTCADLAHISNKLVHRVWTATAPLYDIKLALTGLHMYFYGASRMDKVRNEDVRRKAAIERELASRADQRVLRWFGHVERMDKYRMARRVLMAEVSVGRERGRPRLGWMDGVKVALGNRGMTMEAARQCTKDRKIGKPWYLCN